MLHFFPVPGALLGPDEHPPDALEGKDKCNYSACPNGSQGNFGRAFAVDYPRLARWKPSVTNLQHHDP